MVKPTVVTNVFPIAVKAFSHPPYAKRDCTACHESQFSNAMRGKPGEVCFSCHTQLQTNFVASKVKHQPVVEGDCKSCHNPHQSVIPKLLQKPIPALCLTCHDDPLAAGKFKHQAVETGSCLDCHAPHAANFKGLLKKSVKDTCEDCHDDLVAKKKIVHQPVGDGDCLECHTPHAGKIKGLLKKSVKDTCFGCHDDLVAQKKVVHQPVEDGDCLECHNPHATQIKGLMKKPVKDTCLSCHDDLIGKKKIVHQPVSDGDCLACHNPHASKIKGLLKKSVKDTCADCHDDIPAKNAKVVHQPVSDGDCTACHNPHATDKKALVKKSAPALCWDCHDNFLEKAKFQHDVVEDCTGAGHRGRQAPRLEGVHSQPPFRGRCPVGQAARRAGSARARVFRGLPDSAHRDRGRPAVHQLRPSHHRRWLQTRLAQGLGPGKPAHYDLHRGPGVEEVPQSLLVVGGGYIGMELGTVYASLGSKVVLVETLDTILAGADPDLVRPVVAYAYKAFSEVRLAPRLARWPPAVNTSRSSLTLPARKRGTLRPGPRRRGPLPQCRRYGPGEYQGLVRRPRVHSCE